MSIFRKMRGAVAGMACGVVAAGGVFADHGRSLEAFPVTVAAGYPGVGGWFLEIWPEDELHVGTYRAGGNLEVDWVSYAVVAGSYDALRAQAVAEIDRAAGDRAQGCPEYIGDYVIVRTSAEVQLWIFAPCPEADAIAARDRLADVMRGLVP